MASTMAQSESTRTAFLLLLSLSVSPWVPPGPGGRLPHALLRAALATGSRSLFGPSQSPGQIAAEPVHCGDRDRDQSDWAEEIAEEREAIRLKPDYALAHYDLGRALEHVRGGKPLPEYTVARKLDPHGVDYCARAHSSGWLRGQK